MRTLLVFSLLFVGSSAGIACSADEHCGAPAVNAKCVNKTCEFTPLPPKPISRRATLCSTQADCDDSSSCVDGECVVNNGSGGLCSSDAFCPDGYTCIDGKCTVFRHRFAPRKPGCPKNCFPPWCFC